MPTLIEEPTLIKPAVLGKTLRLTELALVIVVAFAAPTYRSLLVFFGVPTAGGYSSDAAVAYSILNEVVALAVFTYVLSRQQGRWKDFWGKSRPMDILHAVGLFVYVSLATVLVNLLIQKAAYSLLGHYLVAKDVKSMLGMRVSIFSALFVVINPFFEELIVRAYLMTEIIEISGSRALAVLASVALQTAYHLYQGGLNATLVGLCFLIMSIYFAKTRRIAPIILLHLGMDVSALFLSR